MKAGLEVIRGEVAEGGMSALRVVVGYIVTDFQARFAQVAEAATVEQFGFEPTPKGFGVGVILAVAAPAHALDSLMTSH